MSLLAIGIGGGIALAVIVLAVFLLGVRTGANLAAKELEKEVKILEQMKKELTFFQGLEREIRKQGSRGRA
jgi:hypothetical protein